MTSPNRETATDELNRTYEYTYDGDGNLTEIEDPADYATTFTIGDHGLVESMTTPDPDGVGGLMAAETTYAYDEFGRLETITYEDTSTKVYTYDDADNREELAALLPHVEVIEQRPDGQPDERKAAPPEHNQPSSISQDPLLGGPADLGADVAADDDGRQTADQPRNDARAHDGCSLTVAR